MRYAGTIPWEIGRMTSLSYIDISGNYISGTIPALNTLKNLRVVQLDDMRLVRPGLKNLHF
jgi:Leucine-rich repeat (LRR) protein